MSRFSNEEQEMRTAVLPALLARHSSPVVVVNEYVISANGGRVDILVAEVDESKVRERYTEVPVVNCLGLDEIVALENLRTGDRMAMSEAGRDGVEDDALLKLHSRGLVEFTDGLIKLDYPQIITNLTAYELKRFDGKAAIKQAEDRLRIANEAYVVMDDSHLGSATKREREIRERGVGLLSATADEVVTEIEADSTQTSQYPVDLSEIVYTEAIRALYQENVDSRFWISERCWDQPKSVTKKQANSE